jgi:hypothetical protein
MKFIAYFFLKKLPRGTQEQNLGAYSQDFPDTRVAIERTSLCLKLEYICAESVCFLFCLL